MTKSLIFLAILFPLLINFSCKNSTKENIKALLNDTAPYNYTHFYGDLEHSVILSDYHICDIKLGDINRDNVDDLIIVYKRILEGPDDARLMVIYLAEGTPSVLNLKSYSFTAIGTRYCGGMYGDCFIEVEIISGGFSIKHYGGSGNNKWLLISEFHYDQTQKKFFLTKFAEAGSKTHGIWLSHDEFDSYITSKNFGEVSFEEYNYYINYFDY